jgi:muramoyltetrapeptide carboxypeptidase LdcA involved in peptidoglycan recycling
MIAARLQRGDEVRIVSPAVSLGFIPEDQQLTARERLEGLGLRCSFSTNAEVMDRFDSSPVETRVSHLHDAFADRGVKGILTTLGGYNSNGLLGYLDYDLMNREFIPNSGYEVMYEGEAEGKLLGGNLGTLCLLFGTPYMPNLEGSILLLEDDEEVNAVHFDRELQSLMHQPGFEGVRGIMFGKFQRASNMGPETLMAIVESKRELEGKPIIAGASFGHTTTQFTFPIGGNGGLHAGEGTALLSIDVH